MTAQLETKRTNETLSSTAVSNKMANEEESNAIDGKKLAAEKVDVTDTSKMEGTTDEMKSKESEDSSEITTESKMDKNVSEATKSDLQSDNSDNACYKFESDKSTTLQKNDESKSKYSDAVDEANGKCSSQQWTGNVPNE